jgi:hypothetical protein
MTPPGKIARVIAYGLGSILLLLVVGWLWTLHEIRSMRFDFHFSDTDGQSFQTMLKKALADVVVANARQHLKSLRVVS